MSRNLEEFNQVHKNKSAIVIGSGTSIFGLDLTGLKDCVTFAVNSGYVAYPESNYFVSDDWSTANWSYFFRDLQKSPTTLALLYENKFRDTGNIFGERLVHFRHRLGYHVTPSYSHSEKDNHILQARTSVGSAIHIAHIMGCKPIGLLGIDCYRTNNFRYFWEINPSKYNYPFRRDHQKSRFKLSSYKGKQSDNDLIDILDYWKLYGTNFNSCTQVYNLSEHSILDVFPKISLKTFLEKNNAK